jgi:hypothetical protein
MSHKKSKRKKNKQTSANRHPIGGDKLSDKPDCVTVTGNIEAGFPPKLVEKYDAANNKQESWDRKKFRAEIVTIFLVSVYTTVAIWQGCSNKRAADAAKSAAATAAAALKGSQDSFALDQRAWVGPERVVHSKISDRHPSFGMVLRNTGKTPAIDFKSGIMVSLFQKGQFKVAYPESTHECTTKRQPLSARYKSNAERFSISSATVFPQQEFTPLSEPIGDLPHAKQLRTGDPILYIYGWASYQDVFGQEHCTHFCSYLTTDLENARACDTYNDAD